MTKPPRRRSEDLGWATRLWDWIDARQVDRHIVCLIVLFGTWRITIWAMHFAEAGARPGLEVAAILAAVFAPYMLLQTAVVAFYFKARA